MMMSLSSLRTEASGLSFAIGSVDNTSSPAPPILLFLIASASAIIGQIIISRSSAKELYAKLDKQTEVTDEKIKGRIDVLQTDLRTLSNRVDAHNKVVERTYALEAHAAAVDAKLDALERGVHHED